MGHGERKETEKTGDKNGPSRSFAQKSDSHMGNSGDKAVC